MYVTVYNLLKRTLVGDFIYIITNIKTFHSNYLIYLVPDLKNNLFSSYIKMIMNYKRRCTWIIALFLTQLVFFKDQQTRYEVVGEFLSNKKSLSF